MNFLPFQRIFKRAAAFLIVVATIFLPHFASADVLFSQMDSSVFISASSISFTFTGVSGTLLDSIFNIQGDSSNTSRPTGCAYVYIENETTGQFFYSDPFDDFSGNAFCGATTGAVDVNWNVYMNSTGSVHYGGGFPLVSADTYHVQIDNNDGYVIDGYYGNASAVPYYVFYDQGGEIIIQSDLPSFSSTSSTQSYISDVQTTGLPGGDFQFFNQYATATVASSSLLSATNFL